VAAILAGVTVDSVATGFPFDTVEPFHESNGHLDERGLLNAEWARNGYWFFRDVIDHAALEKISSAYVDVLAELGYIASGDKNAVWAGKDLAEFPEYLRPLAPLNAIAPWRDFLSHPNLVAFLSRIVGEPVAFVPMLELRAVPPHTQTPPFVHQDGYFYAGALPVMAMWVPLTDIPVEVGGLGLWEGLHNGPFLHKKSRAGICAEDLPRTSFRHSAYRQGDVVFFDQGTPHCGLPNRSNRFRLSLDVRFVPASAPRPIVGKVVKLTPDCIVVEGGEFATIPITAETYIRTSHSGTRLSRFDAASHIGPGDVVIVALRDGAAALIRGATFPE
jgi:hypothetical protein